MSNRTAAGNGTVVSPPPGRSGARRILAAVAAVLALLLVAGGVLWQRCGLRGCPDVDMLRGYMPDEASVLLDRDGDEIGKLYVTRRTVIGVDSLPDHVLNAFVAIEDRRFWTHGGVDWRRVVGAMVRNIRSGGVEEGSSTITMQLARNVFPEQLPASERTIWRKIGEARVARSIEKRYSKHDIMELYLNQIYFGSGAYGIQAAAEEYFGKDATQLTLAEAATLAALPRAPSRLNPRANEEAAREGRALVLRRMAEQGLITEEERAEAADVELAVRERRSESREVAPYFVEEVRRLLEDQLGTALYTQGYTIHTTLDLDAQRAAEEGLEGQLRAIESGRYGSFPHRTYNSFTSDTTRDPTAGTPYLQAAMVVMDARTGDIVAMVGGRDFDQSQFNRATQAKRQPGSAFKPFVYAAALSSGFTPAHRLIDQPLRYDMGRGQVWEPRNYDGSFAGVVSLRQALVQSRNVPTVRLANEVGMRRVLGTAEQFGLGRMPSNPSVVLGTAEVTPLQLTTAFAPFATLGQRPEPRLVTRVTDRHGHVVWAQEPIARQVVDPSVAFIATSIMQDVVDRGTGTGVRAVGFRGAAAGKTGTTQDAADAWFVGYTPEYVATVWIGLDRRRRILRGATGGEIAAPVWGRVMSRIARGGGGWSPPAGVEQHAVDEMGIVLADGCVPEGGTRTEYFLRGSAPVASCYPSGYWDYAWADTLAPYPSEEWREEQMPPDTADGWWDRLRRRFGRDTLAARPPIAQDPADRRPPGDTARPQPRDTSRAAQADTTRPRPRPIGDPTGDRPPAPPDTNAVSGNR